MNKYTLESLREYKPDELVDLLNHKDEIISELQTPRFKHNHITLSDVDNETFNDISKQKMEDVKFILYSNFSIEQLGYINEAVRQIGDFESYLYEAQNAGGVYEGINNDYINDIKKVILKLDSNIDSQDIWDNLEDYLIEYLEVYDPF